MKTDLDEMVKIASRRFPLFISEGYGEYFDQDQNVVVELISSDSSTCWSSTFTTATKNESDLYKAKAP